MLSASIALTHCWRSSAPLLSLRLPALPTPLQATQIGRHVTELLDDYCIAEVAGGRIAGPTERYGPHISGLARQGIRAHDDRRRIEPLGLVHRPQCHRRQRRK